MDTARPKKRGRAGLFPGPLGAKKLSPWRSLLKIFKGIVAAIFGFGIFYNSLLGGAGSVRARLNGVDLPTELIIASLIGTFFGLILMFASFLILKGKSNERLENGMATIGLGLLLLFFWPCRQFHYWKTGNNDYSSSSLVWGSVVTIAAISRGMWLVYTQKRQEKQST